VEKFKDAAGNVTVQKGAILTLIITGRDGQGNYELNTVRVEQPKDWTAIEQAFESKAIVRGQVLELVKGGLRVDVGVRAFMPASRSGTRDINDMTKLVGQTIECRITKVDKEKDDVVVDRRAVIEEAAEAAKSEAFGVLAEGQILEGTVRSITEYGAFIDLGGIDGLVHVAEMSWNRVAKPGDVVSVGDRVPVKILKINRDTRKISLGMKQLMPEPWSQVESKFKVGDRIQGPVVRLTDFGAFVELEPGIDGMIHVSEMSWSKKVRKPSDLLKVGETVDAQILGVNAAEKRIALGLKQALGDPWESVKTQFPVGTVVEVPIESITKFGAFVNVTDEIEGMIHIADITNEKRLEHPKDALTVGQVVKAKVIELDKERRRLRLGMKQLEPTKTDEFIAAHQVGETVTGRVIEVHAERAKVDLGEGVFAVCKLKAPEKAASPAGASSGGGSKVDVSALSAMLAQKWKQGGGPAAEKDDGPKPGQVRSFKITLLDAETKKIDLELA
jgi:small subunit ribosomal protein S1